MAFSDWQSSNNQEFNSSFIDLDTRSLINSTIYARERNIIRIIVACASALICSFITVVLLHLRRNPNLSNFAVVAAIVVDTAASLIHVSSTWMIGQPVHDTVLNSSFCSASWIAVILTSGWPLWSLFVVSYDRLDNALRPFNRRLTSCRAAIVGTGVVIGGATCCVILMTGCPNPPGLVSLSENTSICVLYAKHHSVAMDNAGDVAFSVTYYTITAFVPTILSAVYFGRLIHFAWQKQRPVAWSSEESTSSRILVLIKTKGFICIVAICFCKVVLVIPQRALLLLYNHYYNDINPNLLFTVNEVANSHSMFTSVLYVLWLKTKSYQPSSHDVLSFARRRQSSGTRRQSNLETNAATTFATKSVKSQQADIQSRNTSVAHSATVESKEIVLKSTEG